MLVGGKSREDEMQIAELREIYDVGEKFFCKTDRNLSETIKGKIPETEAHYHR